ncbi:MAG: UvrABC system protein B [Candidatus Hepatoplasma vulgare]|nr:MAG: UvrABC system protein B [Candidatus Hepatoplasma sp.]
MERNFELITDKIPSGDQPRAIKEILEQLKSKDHIVLLGATGTGKTFTMANVIEKYKRPTLVMAHNKTLANQLFIELKDLFPNNRVEYYISNFDFYQPEAYLPKTDTYIEKQSVQNWQIEMMRNSALNALTSRNDVIVVSSVASIYGHRSPDEYKKHHFEISLKQKINKNEFLHKLIKLGYKRSSDLSPGNFIVNGDLIELAPSWTDQFNLRIDTFDDVIEEIVEIDSLNKDVLKFYKSFTITPANPNVFSQSLLANAVKNIKKDLKERLSYFEKEDLRLEKQRLENKVNFDIEQFEEFGMTSGIENYSIYFEPWRKSGEPPATLFSYFPKDFLLIVDESHMSIPQIRGMYEGDKSRKESLVKYGFRLPTALDNRPLRFPEFEKVMNKVIYTSATPGDYELGKANHKVVEQIIRPTGLIDPTIEIRKEENQINDLIKEIQIRKDRNERVFINTTTKKLAEDIASFLTKKGFSIAYLHSELKTFQREEVLRKLRIGFYDGIVGINLLKEGIDVPEVSLLAVLEADKEGFLRNTRSLIQMIGRVARNVNGHVIFYATNFTKSMKEAIRETERRREIQLAFNKANNITPRTIIKKIPEPLIEELAQKDVKISALNKKDKIKMLEKEMTLAAKKYDFEKAIKLRDMITELKG